MDRFQSPHTILVSKADIKSSSSSSRIYPENCPYDEDYDFSDEEHKIKKTSITKINYI